MHEKVISTCRVLLSERKYVCRHRGWLIILVTTTSTYFGVCVSFEFSSSHTYKQFGIQIQVLRKNGWIWLLTYPGWASEYLALWVAF